jgi:hypothetical protein
MTALGYEHDDELVEQMKAKRYIYRSTQLKTKVSLRWLNRTTFVFRRKVPLTGPAHRVPLS